MWRFYDFARVKQNAGAKMIADLVAIYAHLILPFVVVGVFTFFVLVGLDGFRYRPTVWQIILIVIGWPVFLVAAAILGVFRLLGRRLK